MERDDDMVRAVLAAMPRVRAAVVARQVGGPNVVSIAPDAVLHAASTMKVAVMVELYRRVAAGTLQLSDTLPVSTQFLSIADGSPYTLAQADDSEFGLYGRLGEPASLGELTRLMITLSSNVATNMLVDHLGVAAISATMAALCAPSVVVLRGVEDGSAHTANLNNTVTAGGLATLLEGLALGRVVSPAASAEMLDILLDQKFNQGIPAGLPSGTRVAHKTGSITGLFHDAGVVLTGPGSPWVIVVLTEGLDEVSEAPALVADVTRAAAAAIAGSRA